MPPDPTDISSTEPVSESATEPIPQLAEPIQSLAEPIPPPPPERRPFWGYTDLALLIGLLIACVAVIVVAVGVVAFFDPKLATDPTPALLPTQFALYLLLYLCFYIVIGQRYHRPVLSSLGWRRSNMNLLVVVLGGIVLAIAVAGLATLLHTPKIDSPIDKLASSTPLLVTFAIMAVTIAPFFEELLFRGFLQPLLSRTFGVPIGILITAVVFGSAHGPQYAFAWQYVVAVSLVGVALGWVRYRADSIIPSTVLHASYNAIFVVAFAVTKHV